MATEGTAHVPSFKVTPHGRDYRAHNNPFPDYLTAMSNETSLLQITDEIVINTEFVNRIKYYVAEQLEVIGEKYFYKFDREEDRTVYTGSCGLAYLYIKLSRIMYRLDSKASKSCLEKAGDILEKARKKLYKTYPAFLMGDGGPWTLSILHSVATGDKEGVTKYTKELVDLHHRVVCAKKSSEDEILYGNAGYLYCLLLIRKEVPDADVPDEVIKKVSDMLIAHGTKLAQLAGPDPPLMYSFANTKYLGAAHGLAGIVYLLLCSAELRCNSETMDSLRACVDYLQRVKLPSGNFPSQFGDTSDLLVQWCHGAPGVAVLFCKAYSLTHNMKYLKTAVNSAKLVWDRGLLTKGMGLCHGAAGNGYTFLQLYKVTQDAEYIYYALKFAEWCMDATTAKRTPDRPYTMFEGVAGTIYFLNDLLDIKNAAFPGYEV